MGQPAASSPAVSERMRRQATSGTAPELALRKRLHAAGYRYRVNFSPLPGLRSKADLVFTRRRVAVFVDGCFWHACPEHGSIPKSNRAWWEAKLQRNMSRDSDVTEQLERSGWIVLRVWEHEDPEDAAERVAAAVDARAESTL